MTLHECTSMLGSLAVMLGCEVDAAMCKAYHHVLGDIPTELFAAACRTAATTPPQPYTPRWPTAPTFRQWAEAARQEAIKKLAWAPCEACETSPGWVSLEVDGVSRLARCVCWKAHQQRIEQAGLRTPLALPAAVEDVA